MMWATAAPRTNASRRSLRRRRASDAPGRRRRRGARSLLRAPGARSWVYAQTIYMDAGATLDDLREAVNTLEETERTAWRVFGGAHPLTETLEQYLRAALRARETPSGSA